MADVNITVASEEPATETLTEMEPEAVTEAIETVSDNEVTIAAIEAEKEIAIAEIHAEARVEEAKAYNGNDDQWQTSLSEMKETLQTLTETVANLSERVSLLTLAEVMETQTETITETDLTPVSISPETSEMLTEVSPESGEEKQDQPAPETLEVKVAGKPIIQLV